MHDIDRTQLELGHEMQPTHHEAFEFQEFGHEVGHEFGGAHSEEMSEHDEMALAHELLAVHSEHEFEQFLGKFINRAVSTVGQIAQSPIGNAIGGVLKGVAKKALPMAGGALGGWIGGPLGARIGSGLATAAGQAMGLETEMHEEEHELAGARRFVRIANVTARQAATAAARGSDPRTAAMSAAMMAARRLAPGLVANPPGAASAPNPPTAMNGAGFAATYIPPSGSVAGSPVNASTIPLRRAMSGRWVRHGSRIILYGA